MASSPFGRLSPGSAGLGSSNSLRCAVNGGSLIESAFAVWVRPHILTDKRKGPEWGLFFYMAERVGFEPTVQQAVHLISSQAHSTTLAPLRLLNLILSRRFQRQYT